MNKRFKRNMSPDMIVESIINRIEDRPSVRLRRRPMVNEMAAPSKFYKVNQGWVSKDEAKRIRDEYIAKLRADGEDVPSGRVYIGGNSAGLKQVVDKYKNPAGEFVGGDASSAASNFTNYKQGAADRKAARIADGTYGQRSGRKMSAAPAVIDQADKGAANKAIKAAFNTLKAAVESGEEIDEIDLFSDNKEQNIIEWFETEVVSSMGEVSSSKTAISNYVDGVINGATAIKAVITSYIEAFGL